MPLPRTPRTSRAPFALLAAALLLPAAPAPAVAAEPPASAPRLSETITLFDGKTLDGWEGHADRWSVRDGAIVGRNDTPVKVSTYLLTKRTFTDFRLRLKAKLVESEMHTGVAIWGRNAPEHGDRYTYAGHLVMFPSGWGLYDLFGRNGIAVDAEPAKKVGRQHDWNDLEVLAVGDRIRLAANGAAVLDWRDPLPDRIKAAPIGLQLHSNAVPQEVQFKDLVLETFPKEDRLLSVQ